MLTAWIFYFWNEMIDLFKFIVLHFYTFFKIEQAWCQGTPTKNPKTYKLLKFIQLVSIMMLKCCTKKWSQKILSYSGDNFCQRKFVAKPKNQTVKLLEKTKSICCLYECLPICKKSASQLNSVFRYYIFNIRNTFGMPRCAWPHPYEWTTIKWTQAYWCNYVCLTTCKKSNS